MTEFFIPMKSIPTVTHQQKQVNFNTKQFYEPVELKEARAKFMSLLAKHVPTNPIKGPVRLTVKWLYPKTKNSLDGQYKATKPDIDNIQKLLLDVMSDLGYWVNDSRIASMIVEKFYSDKVGIYVRIERL